MRLVLRVLCRFLLLATASAAGWWLRATMEAPSGTSAAQTPAEPRARGRHYEPRRSLAEPDGGPPPPLDIQAFRTLNAVRQQPRKRRRPAAG